jgi:circadian clock protein KaiC
MHIPLLRTRDSQGKLPVQRVNLADKDAGGDSSGQAAPRAKTGIVGLDSVLNGGIPKGNVVLLTGACGTGKTTLALEMLVNGAKEGEAGIFITTTEPVERVIDNAATYAFFDRALVGKKLHFFDAAELFEELRISPDLTDKDVEALLKWLARTVKEKQAQRLVLDSLTGICQRISKPEHIREFTDKLGRVLSHAGVTTVCTSETKPGEMSYSTFGVEEAVADGIVLLGNHDSRGYLLRTLQVVKMRGTIHSRARYVFDLTSHGLIMVPMLKASMREG